MADPFVELLARQFSITEDEKRLLTLCEIEMSRSEKRQFQRRLRPKLDAFQTLLEGIYRSKTLSGETTPEEWATEVAANVVSKGCAGVIDRLLTDIVGRKQVGDLVKILRRSQAR